MEGNEGKRGSWGSGYCRRRSDTESLFGVRVSDCFLSAWQYQNKTGNRALKALDEFVARLNALMKSAEIMQWVDGLPQGD